MFLLLWKSTNVSPETSLKCAGIVTREIYAQEWVNQSPSIFIERSYILIDLITPIPGVDTLVLNAKKGK